MVHRPKLGKKPFTPSDKDFKFSLLREAQLELPTPPSRFGHGLMYRDWGMLGNDKYGDCVFAGFAHQAMISSRLGSNLLHFTTTDVLSDYSAVTGFDPADPSTDQGAYVRDALSYWRKTGIRAEGGHRHHIGAYVSIDPGNWNELQQAAFVFSSVGIGWEVPSTIWDQWDNHDPFDVVDENAEIEGGHYTLVTGRCGNSTGGMITWAQRKSFMREFYETYNDETWAIVFPDELRNGVNERGFDLTELNNLLSQLA